ncbi:unnamed protein product [Pedinophyceae sp. YPF-701]|nr:unnamed protein product [Pedinophyceae sp. YPF-701]
MLGSDGFVILGAAPAPKATTTAPPGESTEAHIVVYGMPPSSVQDVMTGARLAPLAPAAAQSAVVVYGEDAYEVIDCIDVELLSTPMQLPGDVWIDDAPPSLGAPAEPLGHLPAPAGATNAPLPPRPAPRPQPRDPGLDDENAVEVPAWKGTSPRRTARVRFKCKPCGTVTIRPVNPQALRSGTVLAACGGCGVIHKLRDHLGVFHELDGSLYPTAGAARQGAEAKVADALQALGLPDGAPASDGVGLGGLRERLERRLRRRRAEEE